MNRLAAGATAALLVLFAIAIPAQATQPSPEHKVTICHRTDSETNPYVQITVDQAAVDGIAAKGKGDHLLEHTGDVWFPGHAKEPKWGDIIPSFYSDGTPDGLPSLNWPAGQAIFENGCKPVETKSPGPSATPGDSPDESCGTDLDEVGDNDVDNNPCPSTSTSPSPSVSPSTSPSATPSPTPTPTPTETPASSASSSVAPSVTPSNPGGTLPPTDTAATVTATAANPWAALLIVALALTIGAFAIRSRVRRGPRA